MPGLEKESVVFLLLVFAMTPCGRLPRVHMSSYPCRTGTTLRPLDDLAFTLSFSFELASKYEKPLLTLSTSKRASAYIAGLGSSRNTVHVWRGGANLRMNRIACNGARRSTVRVLPPKRAPVKCAYRRSSESAEYCCLVEADLPASCSVSGVLSLFCDKASSVNLMSHVRLSDLGATLAVPVPQCDPPKLTGRFWLLSFGVLSLPSRSPLSPS